MEIELDSNEDDEVESDDDNGFGVEEANEMEDEEPQPGNIDNGPPPPAGAYNPVEFEGLNVDDEIKELFEYIGRYNP
jgi:hypothetical protein